MEKREEETKEEEKDGKDGRKTPKNLEKERC